MGERETKDIFMKNNSLIKARYDINNYENKLFILLLHRLQMRNETTALGILSTSEIKKKLNARTVNTREGISKLLSSLRARPIYFMDKDGKWSEYGFLNGFKYDPKNDSFIIETSSEVYELLVDYLKTGYTPINMETWLGLKSTYSQRFYDLLRLWSGTKRVIKYSLKELRELLMLEKKYEQYYEFKRRVLNPAIKELNDTGYFEIDINEIKEGKKVELIEFVVTDLDKRIYFEKTNDNIIDVEGSVVLEADGDDSDNENKTDYVKSKILKDKKVNNKITKKSKCPTILNGNIRPSITKKKDEFYVPNKKLFTAKTLNSFKEDFSEYDFNEKNLKNSFYEAIGTTLDKDDEDKIKVKSYNYFKAVLVNKITKKDEKPKNESYTQTKFHNFEETFTKYSDEEFENIILQSQQKKFG